MSTAADNQVFVSDVQRHLNSQHRAGLKVDGHAGSGTRAAARKAWPGFDVPLNTVPTRPGADQAGTIILPGLSQSLAVDTRSAGQIETLLPQVQPLAAQLIAKARAAGIEIKIISGTRTYAEQQALYLRSRNGKDDDGDGRIDEADETVTKAPAGYSNHNFGVAFDIGIFDGGKYLPESKLYAVVGRLGSVLGLEWGGLWKNFKDEPHFQLRPKWAASLTESAMLAEFRRRVAAKKSLF